MTFPWWVTAVIGAWITLNLAVLAYLCARQQMEIRRLKRQMLWIEKTRK